MRRLLAISFAVAGCAAAAPTCQALELGFNSEDLLRLPTASGTGTDDAGLAAGLAHGREAGATTWRLQARWLTLVDGRPGSVTETADPAWSGYRWAALDRQVRAVVGAGYRPLLWMNHAPSWAEGPERPPTSVYVPPGTWRPDPAAAGAFATALARRYRGDYPDPLAPGRTLPRVGTYQAWNEPNLYTEITPQFVRTGGKVEAVAPGIFRSLVNAIYAGIKSADPQAVVGAGATAPFGDYPAGGNRTPPAAFWRDVLCVRKRGRTERGSASCPTIKFDFYAHNPYSPAAPTRPALNPDDVTVPDLGKLRTTIDAGRKAGTVQPKGPKPLWITELGWDTAPDPEGLSFARQAEYVSGAISTLARGGAQRILFWNMRDDLPIPSYDQTLQSGIFSRGATVAQDTPKLSAQAFRFPFSAYRSDGAAQLWGKAPQPGRVEIQAQHRGRWSVVTTLRARTDGVFSKRRSLARGTVLRAVQGDVTSLSWTSH